MNKENILYKEYNDLKKDYLSNKTINSKEDLKNKLIELDYEKNKIYEENLNNNFSMTTTLEKEEKRLQELIKYVTLTVEEQKKLVEDYKKLTNQNIELSYIKYSDNILELKQRLDLVKKILVIKKDLLKLMSNPKETNNTKIKLLKNKLMKKELLNLLYEFCLIDSLDIKDIDINKLVKIEKETSKPIQKEKVQEISQEVSEEKAREEIENLLIKLNSVMKKSTIIQDEIKENEEKEPEDKILTSMPKIDKLGTVTPVNVFESIKKTEEKLPDVVIPTNGLTEEKNEIFINTNEYFK